MGGSDFESGDGIAVDSVGNAYVTGYTSSANFPTVNAKYSQHWGDSDAFVTKLSANGQTVIYSTYLGGSVSDFGLVPTLPRGNADGGAPAPHSRKAARTDSHAGAWEPEKSSPFGKAQGKGNVQIGFQVAEYDHNRPLVIDPVLVYSTYLGGSDSDGGYGIAVDSAGNAYVTGYTTSVNFPAVNAKYSQRWGDRDAFVTKLSANGQTVVYSTYLGGSGFETGYGIAVDSAANATVVGATDSTDFPTVNAKYSQRWGGGDAFVTKLSANGQTVIYSTYLGGSNWDEGHGIAMDSAGNAIVTGWTSSADFPVINAKYPQHQGFFDAFVAKLSANGQTVVYSTYLGGSDYDEGRGIAVDNADNTYVTGYTNSTNFPAVNAKYPQRWGERDTFVTKLNSNGQTVVYSTYLGGSDFESGDGIAVDSVGNAYVTGYTSSANFPTVNAKYSQHWGDSDAFVTKLSANGQTVIYSTYLGGSVSDFGYGIAVDSAGNAYVTGETDSADFPNINARYPQYQGGYDAFVTKLSANGQTVAYSTYLGSSFSDEGTSIAVDSVGNAYVTGDTGSADFPTSATDPQIVSYDPTYNGGANDAFVAKLNSDVPISGGVIKVTRTTNQAVILSHPGASDNPNNFHVSIINSTGTWYVMATTPESIINSANTPLVFILGPYQTKGFDAQLAVGQKLGWYAISPLGAYYAFYQNDRYPAARETAIAAFCLFSIDIVARGIFSAALPPDFAFNVDTFLNTVDDLVAVLGLPTLDLATELINQSATGDANLFAPAIWKYISSLKQVSQVTGPSLYSVISQVFGKDIGSWTLGKLGGINTILDLADLPEKVRLLKDALDQALHSPSDDYLEIRVDKN